MNTDTIRTGFENALHSLDCELSGFERSDDEYLEIQIPYDAKCTCGLDDALAELDKAPKALTDEEIEKLRLSREREDGRRATSKYGYGFADGLRYARDNGYLAPAAELTVDEAMECVRKWIGLPFMAEDLHTRLTTKLNSKNNVY